MDYQRAKDIRGKSLSNIIAETIASGGGIGESIKHGISMKSAAKMTGIKETFDPMNIAKFMTGGSKLAPAIVGRMTGRSKKDIGFFTGKSKSTDTASKVGPLEKGNEFNDILMKIYAFMKSSNDADIKRREDADQFAEEKAYEKGRRHKELMEAITGKKYTGNLDKPSATKVEDEKDKSSFLDDILDAFGMGKDILNVLKVMGGFIASPLGVAFIGAVVAGTVGAWMIKQIAGDPQGALEGKGGIGMAVAGLGSEGQLPSYDEEQKDKAQKKLAEAVDKKGIKSATVPELEAKRDLLVSYGKAKSPEVAELENEIKSRKVEPANSTPAPVPTSSAAPTASETPAPPASGQKLSQVQNENINLNIPTSKEDPSSVINNNSVKTYAKNGDKIPMPSVRNTEPTFANMILYSTRVV